MFLVLAVLVDWESGGLTPERAALWALLGGAVFALLLPPRVVAGEGWLEVRTLARRRRVRTDALVTVQHSGAIAARLILCDTFGGRAEVDPRVLAANPLLWHRLDTDAGRARRRGTLRAGVDVLRRLEEQISGDQAWAVFTFSGLIQRPGSGSGTRPGSSDA
ncbi:hypothetical protein GCM10010430_36830 [Kitasatospora cystarginea]|uniref:Uncharacterized protein n=1 Tax=Kitasatospora cystarginea TaxID=58350 RepID=A0ABN3E7T2_9ACTN